MAFPPLNQIKCESCNGMGETWERISAFIPAGSPEGSAPVRCEDCNGTGYIKAEEQDMTPFSIKSNNKAAPYAHLIDGVDVHSIDNISAFVADYAENAIVQTSDGSEPDYEVIFAEWVWSGELEEAILYIREQQCAS